MKNKKIVTLLATIGLITCLYTKTNATLFYDTKGTRYEGSVERLGELKIINGIADKTFGAEKTITRAEFAKMIVETTLNESEINLLAEENTQIKFSDISKSEWYYKYVLVAANMGYINGYEDGTFKPNKEVTYEEASKIIMKLLGHGYLLENDPKGWATEYVDKMYVLDLFDNTATFDVKSNATRGNIAIILWNAMKQNVWDKVMLNDKTGFTFVDSGQTLFSREIKGHIYSDDRKVTGFKQENNHLYIKIGESYYKYFDQDSTATFSMIGGDAEALLKYIRYPWDYYSYEAVGASADVGAQIYAGTFDELSEDGYKLNENVTKVGNGSANFAYYIKSSELDERDRVVTVNSSNKRFYIESVKIDVKTDKTMKDDPEDIVRIKSINSPDYYYITERTPSVRTITINNKYTIADGAVLFKNNKVVDWKTLEKGDILSEIEKDKYYFVSNDEIEVKINDFTNKSNIITLNTSKGEFICYSDTTFLDFFQEDVKELIKLNDAKLNKLKGKKVKLILDFAGKVARIEMMQTHEDSDLLDVNLGFLTGDRVMFKDGKELTKITLTSNKQRKMFDTTMREINAYEGDLIKLGFKEDSAEVNAITVVTGNVKLNDKLSIKKEKYSEILKKIKNNQIVDDVLVCEAKYIYDFGNYDRVKDVEITSKSVEYIETYDENTTEFYTIVDEHNVIRTIIIRDFSNKEKVYYGKVLKVKAEDNALKIKVDVIGNKEQELKVTGILNCDEGDLISFIVPKEKEIKVLEKYTTKTLGFHKDIIVKKVNTMGGIITDKGEVNLKEGYISIDNKNYDLNDYTIIMLSIEENKEDEIITEENKWLIKKAEAYPLEKVVLRAKDRIVIDEIEDTVIIYRGYRE